jgi:hypothetical protein
VVIQGQKSRQIRYLQVVENRRENGAVRQHVIATLGRLDDLAARGGLAALLVSGARYCDQILLLSALAEEVGAARLSTRRIGGPLLFGRLWEQLGIQAALTERLAARTFEFAVERAVFVSVLHRLFVSGSDRDSATWMSDYRIPGTEGLALHHFYRAMAWLGEELGAVNQSHRTHAPRCVKDEIEEALFAGRRDLFSDVSVVFMDITTLRFAGAGAGGSRPFQGPPARSPADDLRGCDRRRGAPRLHRDVARQLGDTL